MIKILLQLAVAVFITTSSYSQMALQMADDTKSGDSELKITGIIPGLKEGDRVLLQKYYHNPPKIDYRTIDTAIVKNGKFYFTQPMTDGPRLFMIIFPSYRKFVAVPFGIEDVTMTSRLNINDIPQKTPFEYFEFSGSKIAQDFLYLMAIDRLWYNSTQSINASIYKYKDSLLDRSALEQIIGLIEAKRKVGLGVQKLFTNDFYAKRAGAVCEFFTECPDADRKYDSLWVSVYRKLDDATRKSYYGKFMGENISVCVGQTAPDFHFTTSDGKSMNLQQVAKANQLTLLHFWSYETPEDDRKKIHTDQNVIYKKYHPKGFEIINISMDANETKWKKCIDVEKISGYHINDLKEELGEAAMLYKLNSKQVANVLVDHNGKIVAWETYGPELYGYLFKVFGE